MNSADKIMRDKLSSLENLPEDYVPNAEAKWSIIEASIQKRTTNYKWIGIAACLLLFGLAFIWTLNNKPSTTIIVQSPLPEQQRIYVPKVEVARVVEVAQKKVNKHKQIVAEPIEIINPATEQIVEKVPVQTIETVVNEKKRQRYVEVDFNDPVQVTKPVENNFASAIKFKLNFKKENNSENSETKLSLKRNF